MNLNTREKTAIRLKKLITKIYKVWGDLYSITDIIQITDIFYVKFPESIE